MHRSEWPSTRAWLRRFVRARRAPSTCISRRWSRTDFPEKPTPSSFVTILEEIRTQLEPLRDRLEIIYLKDLPLDELLARVEALPADSILFLARQGIRTRQQSMETVDALHEIVRVARVPTYGATDRLVGEGFVGGLMLSSEGDGALLAETALRIVNGVPVRDIPPREGVTVTMFDWRQLRRFGIHETLLPPGSDVRFRELTFWDLYGRYALAAFAVTVGQAALIAGLLLHRARRRRAEAALRGHEAALMASHQEIKTLAGRSIAAQEVERARIGRELHDDVCQKLAVLNIDVTQLGRLARVEDHAVPNRSARLPSSRQRSRTTCRT